MRQQPSLTQHLRRNPTYGVYPSSSKRLKSYHEPKQRQITRCRREGSYAYSLRRGGILYLLIDVRLQDPFSFLREIFTYIYGDLHIYQEIFYWVLYQLLCWKIAFLQLVLEVRLLIVPRWRNSFIYHCDNPFIKVGYWAILTKGQNGLLKL